ncbi:MAG: lysophospholipid acyltransferase family protein [Oligoflexia bacterium]|nr:lysophospholipid acyltransferase family protein [Oligoflexia bacterium]
MGQIEPSSTAASEAAKASNNTGGNAPGIRMLARLPFKIRFQRAIAWLLCIPFCGLIAFSLRRIGRFQIEDMTQVRAEAKRLLSKPGPIVVCGNHLTFIDSILLIWAFADNFWYVGHYNRFTWNLPAGDVFSKKLTFRLVAYLGKCIFVYRDGSHRHKGEIIALAKTLVAKGEVLTIFPEGRRSRSNRFEMERLTSGAGKIIAEVPGCRVICAYLRSDLQDGMSNYPPRGSRFYLKLREIEPRFTPGDRNAPTEVTRQIGETIQSMENEFFARK